MLLTLLESIVIKSLKVPIDGLACQRKCIAELKGLARGGSGSRQGWLAGKAGGWRGLKAWPGPLWGSRHYKCSPRSPWGLDPKMLPWTQCDKHVQVLRPLFTHTMICPGPAPAEARGKSGLKQTSNIHLWHYARRLCIQVHREGGVWRGRPGVPSLELLPVGGHRIDWHQRLAMCLHLVQFNSVAQSCPTLCDPTDCSMPGLSVHHQLLELAQTHVHWVSDAIQPSHPLSSPSPPTFNLSQHQGLFQSVSSSHQMAKVLEFQLQHQFFQWLFRTDLL